MIELHYLIINSILEICKLLPEEYEPNKWIEKLPEEVNKYNDIIHIHMNKWMPFIHFLSLALFISGIVTSLVLCIPIIKNYKVIRMYAGYGFFSSFWLLLISLTYSLYNKYGCFFPIIIIIIVIVIEILKNVISKLKT